VLAIGSPGLLALQAAATTGGPVPKSASANNRLLATVTLAYPSHKGTNTFFRFLNYKQAAKTLARKVDLLPH
jgi:hypothetical protein